MADYIVAHTITINSRNQLMIKHNKIKLYLNIIAWDESIQLLIFKYVCHEKIQNEARLELLFCVFYWLLINSWKLIVSLIVMSISTIFQNMKEHDSFP